MRVVEDVLAEDAEHRRILVYDCGVALFHARRYSEAAKIAMSVAEEYLTELGLGGGLASENLPEIWNGIKKTESTQSDLKRLADCLDLYAMSSDRLEKVSFPARLHAHKFYILAGAYRSAIRVGQDCADELLSLSNDPLEARGFIEQSLLPAVGQFKLMDYVVPVRSQYAVIIAYCGDNALARKEISKLFEIGLEDEDRRREVERQSILMRGSPAVTIRIVRDNLN